MKKLMIVLFAAPAFMAQAVVVLGQKQPRKLAITSQGIISPEQAEEIAQRVRHGGVYFGQGELVSAKKRPSGMGKLPLVSHIALDTQGSGVVQAGETCDLLLTGAEHGVISCGNRVTFKPGEYVTVAGSPTGTPPNKQFGARYIGSHVDNAGSKPGAGRRTIYLLPEAAVIHSPVEFGTEF